MSTDADIAVLASNGSYLASLGVLPDAMSLIATNVAALFPPPNQWRLHSRLNVLSVDGAAVALAGGRLFAVDAGLAPRRQFRLVYLPAFEPGPAESLEARLAQAKPLLAWLQRQREGQAILAASGAATVLLAEAGLLTDGVASMPKQLAPWFRRRYPRIRLDAKATVVEHDGIFTAAAAAAEWQLATRLVELVFSPRTASWLAAATGVRGSQVDQGFLSEDPLVAGAQFWLNERFAANPKISELARDLAVSHHTLIRRFAAALGTSPRQYLQTLRVESAKNMLWRTKRSIGDIGMMVGYADVRAFRAVFQAHTSMSPSDYRLTQVGRQ